MKKSWQTTEFWTMLITNVVGIVVLSGAVGAEEGEELGNALKSIAGAAISIATTLGYIKNRTDIKKAKADAISSWNLSTGKTEGLPAEAEAKARDHVVECINKLGV